MSSDIRKTHQRRPRNANLPLTYDAQGYIDTAQVLRQVLRLLVDQEFLEEYAERRGKPFHKLDNEDCFDALEKILFPWDVPNDPYDRTLRFKVDLNRARQKWRLSCTVPLFDRSGHGWDKLIAQIGRAITSPLPD